MSWPVSRRCVALVASTVSDWCIFTPIRYHRIEAYILLIIYL